MFSFLFGLILSNAAAVPYDPVELEAVEEKAKSIDIDDTSAILDVVHDDTRKMTAAARSDRILGEARADLWRKKKDKEEQIYFASEGAEDAMEEQKRAVAEAERARSEMVIAAKKKVLAENRIAAADDRMDDADVHIEEALAKKEAAKIVSRLPLARMRAYHPAPSASAAAHVAALNRRSDAEEREEEAMAFVRADKDVKHKDHYKAPTLAHPESNLPAFAEDEDEKEAQSEMASAMKSAANKVRGMLEETA